MGGHNFEILLGLLLFFRRHDFDISGNIFLPPGNDLIANPCLQPKFCQYYNDLVQMFQKISSRYFNALADERLAFVPLHSFVT